MLEFILQSTLYNSEADWVSYGLSAAHLQQVHRTSALVEESMKMCSARGLMSELYCYFQVAYCYMTHKAWHNILYDTYYIAKNDVWQVDFYMPWKITWVFHTLIV